MEIKKEKNNFVLEMNYDEICFLLEIIRNETQSVCSDEEKVKKLVEMGSKIWEMLILENKIKEN